MFVCMILGFLWDVTDCSVFVKRYYNSLLFLPPGVSGAILKAAGQTVVDECKTKGVYNQSLTLLHDQMKAFELVQVQVY